MMMMKTMREESFFFLAVGFFSGELVSIIIDAANLAKGNTLVPYFIQKNCKKPVILSFFMEIQKTPIQGLLILKPRVAYDPRGYFYESYRKDLFDELGINDTFVQDNQSLSQKGILRGLHFQAPPHAQGKLVRVIAGAVLDVVVDIRKASPTYGQQFSITLTSENLLQFWVPLGFAHGFLTLEDNTIFAYKCTNYYNKSSEGGIRWNDPALGIDWNVENPLLSDKDKLTPLFQDFDSPF